MNSVNIDKCHLDNTKKYTKETKNNNSLLIFHQNVQCLKNKILEMEILLDNMEVCPKLVCVTEHWYTENEKTNMKIEKYTMISSFTRKNKAHGGSAIFAQDGYDAEEVEELQQKSIEGHLECSSVCSRSQKLLVLCIYRPPLGELDLFFNTLTDILNICYNKFFRFKMVLCGDFNINLLDNNSNTKSLLNILTSFNFSQKIFDPTRIANNSKTLLDNIFINFENIYSGEIITTALSDHEGQLINICLNDNSDQSNQSLPYAKRIFSIKKIQQFKEELQNFNWTEILYVEDPNICYNLFVNKIINLMNIIFPIKKIKNKPKNKSWITMGIKTSCETKRNLYKQKISGEISNETYSRYSKLLKKVINEAKKNQMYLILKTRKTEINLYGI